MNDKIIRATPWELFRFFLTVGVTAFGGPVAHLAILQREAVEKRGWMSKEEFVDVMGLLNLIPGPNSTQMVMYFGHRHAGVLGMLAAGLGFIVPAAAITLVLAAIYLSYGTLPQGQAIMWGIQPVVVGVIASAMWRLVPKGLDNWPKRIIFAMAAAAALMGVSEVVIILGAGVVGWIWFSRFKPKLPSGVKSIWPAGFALIAGAQGTGYVAVASVTNIFLAFFKMAIVLYGSGYLLVAYMQSSLVDNLGWLSVQQMLDVLAIGQMTPGPFLTTATAAGMVMAGFTGALAATVGIFLPSFFLIGILGKRVQTLRNSSWGKHFLAGLNPAVIAVLLVVAYKFASGIAAEPIRLLLAAVTLYALEKWKTNSMLLIGVGAAIGLVWQLLI